MTFMHGLCRLPGVLHGILQPQSDMGFYWRHRAPKLLLLQLLLLVVIHI
jgi:hypothetical protein